MKTLQEIKQYLNQEWKLYVNGENTPERLAYGDALYLFYKSETPESLVEKLEENRERVRTSVRAYPDKEWRKETVNWYNIIINEIKK